VWGSFDHTSMERFDRAYPDVRRTIEAIVRMLERYEVAATWAVVGHLFLGSCERDPDGVAHPELAATRQSHWDGNWYSADPCTDMGQDPLWYGPDILDMLEAASVPQEIACHSFGHAVFGDTAFTREAAAADVQACLALGRRRGLELRSFVFPRNVEGHLDVLREHGFVAFRGADRDKGEGWPRPLRRARHLGEHLAGSAPSVWRPREALPGLWDVRGSMLIMSRTGIRRLITRSARKRAARAGLAAATATGGVFHLWTHPFNIASDPSYLLASLEDVLVEAVRRRDAGVLIIETMASIAERAAAAGARGGG
jgi:hypothetical protein